MDAESVGIIWTPQELDILSKVRRLIRARLEHNHIDREEFAICVDGEGMPETSPELEEFVSEILTILEEISDGTPGDLICAVAEAEEDLTTLMGVGGVS